MNKCALVTGATNGTGFSIASRFAKEGYDVIITSRDKFRADSAARVLREKYGINAEGIVTLDFNEPEVSAIFDYISSTGRFVSTLVLNAANLGVGQSSLDVPFEDFMEVINMNMGFNFLMARTAARYMKDMGGGSVVFVTSNTAYRAIPDRCAYGASKSGVLGMSRSLAIDLGKYNIRFNCVLPGMIKTERFMNNVGDIQHCPSAYTPLHDVADFEDIANAAWYFGSDQSRNTTGAELVVDGGNMVQLFPEVPPTRMRTSSSGRIRISRRH